MKKTPIKKVELDYSQVKSIVENWYLSIPLIFQSESGLDLEEIVTGDYDIDYYDGNAIEDLKLDPVSILIIVYNWYLVHYLKENEYCANQNGLICNEDDIELDKFCYSEILNITSNNIKGTYNVIFL
jgi:hypothetical protein